MRRLPPRCQALALGLALAAALACATPAPRRTPGASGAAAGARPHAATAREASPGESAAGAAAARAALSMLGAPYRYSGASPEGFDCSGLVVYSYAAAGVDGLPHSAARLERLARPVSLRELEPGDLLFFTLSGKKTSHVGIYVGERSFVHAPSRGKRVERVSFDHVYWKEHLGRAGRLEL
jgi:cell wall-associated NlpC family hydrolase